MSRYYTIKEHLSAKNTHGEEYTLLNQAIDNMQFQYAKLGALMLLDLAYVEKLNLVADDKAYAFSGKVVTPEFQELLTALNSAENVEIEAEYGLWEYASYDNWDVGPFSTCDGFEKVLENDFEKSKDFYYTMYNRSDSSNDPGVICAYGTVNGKTLNGIIHGEIAPLPEICEWVSEDTVALFNDELTDKMNIEDIKQCANDFIRLGGDVSTESTENGFTFSVNGITLTTSNDVEEFIRICRNLVSASDNKCGVLADFVDFSGKDARTLSIDFVSDDHPIIKIAQV